MILLLLPAALATDAFVGARIHTVSGPVLDGGVLLVEDGRISAVLPWSEDAVPAGATVHDLSGRVVIPGLVDTHSHVGGGRLNDHLSPLQPALSAIDAIDPTHVSLQRAQAGGITTVNVMPGSGKLVGGQTAYLKLRDAAVVDDLLLCRPDPLAPAAAEGPARRAAICGGMKLANGTNPQGEGGDPASRMGAAFLHRQALDKGRQRLDALQEEPRRRWWQLRPPEPEPGPPELEGDAMAQVVGGHRTVHFHTHRADDIVTVLRLQEEYGFDLVLQHVSEAWKVIDEIAASGASASLIVVDSPGGKEEAVEIRAENGALLEAAGVRVAWHSDDPITDSRLLLRSAGLAVRAGMSREGALSSLTLWPAQMLHLDDRIGSLEPGKDADFVVLSGDPLSTWTQVEQTWVEGRKVFDRADPLDRALATGGEALTGAAP